MSAHATPTLEAVGTWTPPAAGLARLQRVALRVALAGVIVCGVGAVIAPDQFFQSYLPAWTFFLQITLGCLGLTMLNHLTHGAWGLVLRRVFEAAAATLPALLLLFAPLLIGLHRVYEWSEPGAMQADAILAKKAGYLNVPFFAARAAIYFGVWMVLALLARRWSLAQDRTGDPALYHKMRALSAAGLVLFVLTVSFASFDWLMSLDPHWFSSIYGVQYVGGAAVAALCFGIIVSRYLAKAAPMSEVLTPKHHQDHGTLLFAFLLLWGYFGVSQFLIIWSANLPEEIPFYVHRQSGGWQWVSLAIVLLHFAVPFLLLLSPAIKRDPRRLATIALGVLVMRWIDLVWQVAPTFHEHATAHWLDLAAVAAVGGLWLTLFARGLRAASLLPVHDPFLPEALAHE